MRIKILLNLIIKVDLILLTNFNLLDILDLLEDSLAILIIDLRVLIALITITINTNKYIIDIN